MLLRTWMRHPNDAGLPPHVLLPHVLHVILFVSYSWEDGEVRQQMDYERHNGRLRPQRLFSRHARSHQYGRSVAFPIANLRVTSTARSLPFANFMSNHWLGLEI